MLQKQLITDLFFDLDHTLWDFDKNSALTFQQIFKVHKMDVALDEFIPVYEDINRDYWKLFREEKISKEALRRGRLRDTFSVLKKQISVETIDLLAVSYIDTLSENNFLFDGTVELLEYLKPKYQLHIITNGFEEVQYKKMKNSKIDQFFNTITNSEMVGVKKPNPKIFHYALEKANTSAEKSVMIGDNLEADIIGAENVGMQTVFFNYKNQPTDHHFSVSNLLEIKNIF
ncbi:MAG: noncanonical pyrimidine nucleotidase, YjjG family [Bacteroidetes bacterium HGW-Bacteroidetes-2]|jgi:putative hydrolase of the HAD superfamily|nr:MAG: noncanonical pyrimidine nucleotidase, YjjG family [Bacteroidetes bacterium HGW-Bacteroidetes-2]